MAVIYSGDGMRSTEMNDKLVYVIPEEGSNLWVDNMCIPKGCEHKEAAECFINFMCRPDIAQMNMDYVRYCSPISQVVENLTEEEKANPAMNPSEEVLARCEFGADTSDVAWKYDDVWMNILM